MRLIFRVFAKRKAITKLRCSDHELEIERGIHKEIVMETRMCKLCTNKKEKLRNNFSLNAPFSMTSG